MHRANCDPHMLNQRKAIPMTKGETTSRGHILVVDSDSRLRSALASILERTGYEVTAVGNLTQAAAIDRSFDIIIADMALPRDIQALIGLSATSSSPRFITIASEGPFSMELSLHMAEQLGTHCVLAEPLELEKLLEAFKQEPPEI